VGLVAAWLSVCAGPLGAAGDEIAGEDALAIAASLAACLDIPFGEDASVLRKEGDFLPPEFEVKFHGFSTTRVDAASGRVTGFVNHSAFLESYALMEGPPIAEANAIEIADSVLRAMGMPEDLVFKSATLKAPIDDIPAWICKWDQTWEGIPYDRGGPEGAQVWVSAATGKVVSAAMHQSPPPPASTEVSISEAEAVDIALAFAQQRGRLFPARAVSAELKIVQPNGYWSDAGPQPVRYDTPTRVAGVIQLFDIGETGRPQRALLFYVDALDGAVIGGAESGAGCTASGISTYHAKARRLARRAFLLLPLATLGILITCAGAVLVRARRTGAR